jgi:hypothetical protein
MAYTLYTVPFSSIEPVFYFTFILTGSDAKTKVCFTDELCNDKDININTRKNTTRDTKHNRRKQTFFSKKMSSISRLNGPRGTESFTLFSNTVWLFIELATAVMTTKPDKCFVKHGSLTENLEIITTRFK